MSTITGIWSEELIREVISYLDKKTGLNGSALPIKLGMAKHLLGRYSYETGKEHFYFSLYYLNDPFFRESEAIDLIRHEYAHYYVEAAHIKNHFKPERAYHHGKAWKYACKMVGASGRRCYERHKLLPDITEDTALELLCAEDIEECNITEKLKVWGRLPIPPNELKHLIESHQYKSIPNHSIAIGDNVLHIKDGFGTVIDSYPLSSALVLRIKFENGSIKNYSSCDIFPIENGIIKACRQIEAISKR